MRRTREKVRRETCARAIVRSAGANSQAILPGVSVLKRRSDYFRFPQSPRQSIEVGKERAAVDGDSLEIEDDVRFVHGGNSPALQTLDVQLVVRVRFAGAFHEIRPWIAVQGK